MYFQAIIRKDGMKGKALGIIFVFKDPISHSKVKMTQWQMQWKWAIFQSAWATLTAKKRQESLPHFKLYTPVICKGDRGYF